jgi:hypothetical protein
MALAAHLTPYRVDRDQSDEELERIERAQEALIHRKLAKAAANFGRPPASPSHLTWRGWSSLQFQ